MAYIIAFFNKNSNIMLFLLLSLISITLIFKSQNYPKTQLYSTLYCWQSNLDERLASVKAYFHLREENNLLLQENKALKQAYFNEVKSYQRQDILVRDTLSKGQVYNLLSAQIINVINRGRNNYYTIDKGTLRGVEEGSGVITDRGIVGQIAFADQKFSSVLSILHPDSKVKCKIKHSENFGLLKWRGEDSRIMHLTDIEKYIQVNINDTVETFKSTIYPEGIPIGTIVDKRIDKSNGRWDLTIQLFQDMNNLDNVYVVKNLEKAKIDTLEKQTEQLDAE